MQRAAAISAREDQRESHAFHATYNRAAGVYSDRQKANLWWYDDEGKLCRLKRRMSRREWIEANFYIQAKNGDIIPLKLNRAQRRFECWVLRMERAGVPIRIIILKARQLGFSTYVQAIMFEKVLRGSRVRALIVADTNERSEILLAMAHLANVEMPKPEWMQNIVVKEVKKGNHTSWVAERGIDEDCDGKWDFRMRSKASSSLMWDSPLDGTIKVTSAEVAAPGRGGTRQLLHMSETAYWANAGQKAAGVLGSLPKIPGTYAFNESTANGASGWFYDDFWRGWKERDVKLENRVFPWVSLFFAWFEHEEYYWTKAWGQGRSMSEKEQRQIVDTLDENEEWLLKQTYFRRWTPDDEWVQTERNGKLVWARKGVGVRKVGLDQLKWRRTMIQDPEIHHDLNKFRQEYPACVTAETRVSTERGILPIWQALDCKRTESGPIVKAGKQPMSAIYRLETTLGRTLRGTFDHPVMTDNGFVLLSKLAPGDRIVLRPPMFAERVHTHRWSPIPGTETSVEINRDWARFIGIWMGDGCWTGDIIEIACDAKDRDVVHETMRLTTALVGVPHTRDVIRKQGSKGCTYIRLGCVAARETFKELELIRRNGEDRWRRWVHVPDCIWRSPKPIVKEFLSGLFETDGSASCGRISMASNRREFLQEVQLLLLGFGINTRMGSSTKRAPGRPDQTTWTLSLAREAGDIFAKEIGFIGARKRKLSRGTKKGPGGRPAAPNEMIDEVASVTEEVWEHTYDFTVGDAHVFSANGILTHNTPEEAFLSSGRTVFDHNQLEKIRRASTGPVWRGEITEAIDDMGRPLRPVPSTLEYDPMTVEPPVEFDPDKKTEQTEFYRLVEARYGAVSVWVPPNPERVYVVAIDASGGGPLGDFACGSVIDAETCALVATIRERCAPIPFGRRCARLAWYYNEALLAFETYPSGHGLIACHSAIQYGYPRIYKRRNQSTASRDVSEEIGWHTSVRTKDMMIGRITEAIQAGYDMPDAVLIEELLAQRYDENGKIVCQGHDDQMDSYAIGLLVRDEAWRRGTITKPKPPPLDDTARFWEAYERRKQAPGRHQLRRHRP